MMSSMVLYIAIGTIAYFGYIQLSYVQNVLSQVELRQGTRVISGWRYHIDVLIKAAVPNWVLEWCRY